MSSPFYRLRASGAQRGSGGGRPSCLSACMPSAFVHHLPCSTCLHHLFALCVLPRMCRLPGFPRRSRLYGWFAGVRLGCGGRSSAWLRHFTARVCTTPRHVLPFSPHPFCLPPVNSGFAPLCGQLFQHRVRDGTDWAFLALCAWLALYQRSAVLGVAAGQEGSAGDIYCHPVIYLPVRHPSSSTVYSSPPTR